MSGKSRPPSESTLTSILRLRYHLHYSKFDSSSYRYRDPTFNEKRLWICRMLSQLIHDKALVICVDESNFRTDSIKGMAWQFNPKQQQSMDKYKTPLKQRKNFLEKNLDILNVESSIMNKRTASDI